jgi:NTP pyrophosphatase (non-canonical NTP hydrolase)
MGSDQGAISIASVAGMIQRAETQTGGASVHDNDSAGGRNMDRQDFETYQRESRKTWNLVATDHPIVYPTLGLANEAGEVAGKVKKIFRDKGGQIGEDDRQALKGELGDVLWYLTQICTELGLTLEEVARANLEKLFSRQERGQIRGEGDER